MSRIADAAPAYLVKGENPSLVGMELARLVERLAGGSGEAGMPIMLEEYAPSTAGGSAARSAPSDDRGDRDQAGRGADNAGGTGSRNRIELGPILDACSTPPFLAERRIVVVRHAGLLDAAQVRLLAAYLSEPLPTTTLVLAADEKAVPAALERAVKAVGEVVDAGVGTGQRARGAWLDSHLSGAPVRLTADAKALLSGNLGEDLGRLPGVLSTLAAAYGDGATVGADELEPFLGAAGGLAPWDLTDALDAGDPQNGDRAMAVLHRMMSGGERHPLQVLGGLHRHYAAMLRLDGLQVTDENHAAQLLGIKKFPAGKALRQSRRLGHERVARAIGLLADADLDIRGRSALAPELVTEILVARLAQLSRAGGPGVSSARGLRER